MAVPLWHPPGSPHGKTLYVGLEMLLGIGEGVPCRPVVGPGPHPRYPVGTVPRQRNPLDVPAPAPALKTPCWHGWYRCWSVLAVGLAPGVSGVSGVSGSGVCDQGDGVRCWQPEFNPDPEGRPMGSRLGLGRRGAFHQLPMRGVWSTRSIPAFGPEPRPRLLWPRFDRRPAGWDRRQGLPCPEPNGAGAAPSGPAPRPEPKPKPLPISVPSESATCHPPDRRIYP